MEWKPRAFGKPISPPLLHWTSLKDPASTLRDQLTQPLKIHHVHGTYQERWWFSLTILVCRRIYEQAYHELIYAKSRTFALTALLWQRHTLIRRDITHSMRWQRYEAHPDKSQVDWGHPSWCHVSQGNFGAEGKNRGHPCCFFCKQRFHRKSTPTNRLKPVFLVTPDKNEFPCVNLWMCLTCWVKSWKFPPKTSPDFQRNAARIGPKIGKSCKDFSINRFFSGFSSGPNKNRLNHPGLHPWNWISGVYSHGTGAHCMITKPNAGKLFKGKSFKMTLHVREISSPKTGVAFTWSFKLKSFRDMVEFYFGDLTGNNWL